MIESCVKLPESPNTSLYTNVIYLKWEKLFTQASLGMYQGLGPDFISVFAAQYKT